MRILVADQNALLLAAITATFGPHCDLVTATRRDVCITQLEQHRFDVVIACDKLSDYTGLELLSEVGALAPDTLLIFAANPKRLNQLGKQLAVFGLFEVLSYPITPQKLVDILKRARQCLRTASKPKVPHVVLEAEWDTGVRLGLVEKDLQAQAETAGRAEHDDWPRGAEAAPSDAATSDVEADDFVFSGPPAVSPDSEAAAPLPRAESRARTFEATPVAPRVTADAGEVMEYEVKPVVLALTHDTGTIACDDEFVFASSQSVSVSVGAVAAELIEVEPAGTPVGQETEPSIEDFCSNDPLFDVAEPLAHGSSGPRWAQDGAANDTAYESKPGHAGKTNSAAGYSSGSAHDANGSQASNNTSSSQAKSSESGNASRNITPPAAPSPKAPPQRRTRTQSVPTEAQRAAFERALARRNAALGAAAAAPASEKVRKGTGSMDSLFGGAPASDRPSQSLWDLAKKATHKRPLSVSLPDLNKNARPKRAVYAVGSGLAAVLILAVITFELHRNSREAEHHVAHGSATSTQIFSSRTMMLDNNQGSGMPQFGPPIQQAAASQDAPPPNTPQAQTFDPNAAPEDPPPPPAVENPGPMEPPSEENVHVGPPLGMIQGQADGATDADQPPPE